jgi:hypothetical protein
MLKLYKRKGKTTEYWEAWEDGRKVIVHWGKLGSTGKSRTIRLKPSERGRAVIKAESQKPLAEGFQKIPLDQHVSIVVQYSTETWGSVADLDNRHQVEDVLNECLGWTGNGHCDGGDIGSGQMNAFSFVVDPKLAGETIVKALKKAKLLDGAIVAYHLPDEEEYTVVWPKRFRGEFSIL